MKVLKNTSVVLFMAAFVAVMLFPVQAADAGTLTTPRDYLSRVKENLATGVQHEVFFTTELVVDGGAGSNEVILVFPDGDDSSWCATTGSDLVVTGITDPTGGSESATELPGTLTGTCAQGSGASSYDTFTIGGVDDLSTTTKYGFRMADGSTAKQGTPAASTTGLITVKTNNGSGDIDTAFTSVDIISDDEVAVSADVPSSITFTLSDNTINLGTLDTGSVSYSSHTVQTVTNAVSGYTTLVYDDGNLRKGSDDIDDVGDGAVTAGDEEYGIGTTDTSQDITNDATCGSAPYSATGITTTQQSVAGATSGPVDETITVCYVASIASTTVAGAYAHTVTYVTVGLF